MNKGFILEKTLKKNQIVNEFEQPVRGVSLNRDAMRRLKKNKIALASLFVVGFYFLIAIIAPFLPIYSYKQVIVSHKHLPPTLTKTAGELMYEKKENRLKRVAMKKRTSDVLNEKELMVLVKLKEKIKTQTKVINGKTVKIHDRIYFFGTDYLGRCMLARTIYGSQISMSVGLVGAVVAMVIGVMFGSVSGYIGGRTDHIMMRFVDIMYGLPYMLIVIILLAFFGRNFINMFIAIACIAWLFVSRLIRGQIISLKNSEFVEASKVCGAGTSWIIMKHMIPNTIGLVIVYCSMEIPRFILLESFLSFIGLGISPPYASWGSLVSSATEGMEHFYWRLLFPAAAMSIFLFAMNFIGDGLRDAFDPQSKNRL